MRALYKAESEWVKERDKMHKDTGEAWEKYEIVILWYPS